MSKIPLTPYLFFSGNCREAMDFYQTVFGGTVAYSTKGDVPGTKPEEADKIMHADLQDADIQLYASDVVEKKVGTGKIELCLGGDDEAHLAKVFEALSQGGTVKSPLKKEFWGDTFGQLTDKYGVDWMVNIRAPKA